MDTTLKSKGNEHWEKQKDIGIMMCICLQQTRYGTIKNMYIDIERVSWGTLL